MLIKDTDVNFAQASSTAILGSSGSGKTTLLNYLSSRMEDSNLKTTGNLTVNGQTLSSIDTIKHRTGYVTQIDIVQADLTPREQFLYTARLSGLSDPARKVQDVIDVLGLSSAADTVVGSDLQRGISGGERKRTSIGIELITDPSLLFLDEPTTGLDSKSALDVALLLKQLAQNSRTVIATIHSPSAEILSCFDRVICLSQGEKIFDDSPSKLVEYFNTVGLPALAFTNPADHLMTIINEYDIRMQASKEGRLIRRASKEAVCRSSVSAGVRVYEPVYC